MLEVVVCEPCAKARGIDPGDLVEYARMGGAGDMATMTKEHHSVLTF